jgi:hypothetical protein
MPALLSTSVTALVVVAVDLLEEGLGVERAGRTGDTGDDRKRNQGGQDGLHGYLSSDLNTRCSAGVSVLLHSLSEAAVTEGTINAAPATDPDA